MQSMEVSRCLIALLVSADRSWPDQADEAGHDRMIHAALSYPLDDAKSDDSRKQFLEDLCNACEKDIRKAFAAGVVRVFIDFTERRLACQNDPNNS